ncbi:MAG: hypothetical protein ACPGEF_01250 [Endozoicomonas sp.]
MSEGDFSQEVTLTLRIKSKSVSTLDVATCTNPIELGLTTAEAKKIASLKEVLQEKETLIESLQNPNQRLVSEIQDNEGTLILKTQESSEENRHNTIHFLKNELARACKVIDEWEDHSKSLVSHNKKIRDQNKKLMQKEQQLTSDFNQTLEEVMHFADQNKELQALIETIKADLTSTQRQLADAQKELESYVMLVRDMSQKAQSLINENVRLKAENKDLSSRVIELQQGSHMRREAYNTTYQSATVGNQQANNIPTYRIPPPDASLHG